MTCPSDVPNCATTPNRAARSLLRAAERIGDHNFAALPEKVRRRVAKVGFVRAGVQWPSEAHRDVIEAAQEVMAGTISPEEAMALLGRSDVEAQRLAVPA